MGPYKQVEAAKSMHNYSSNKPHDSHGFKEEVKINYDAVGVVAGRFLNRIAAMMEFLGAVVPPIDWVTYCAMPPADQLV